MLKRSKREMEDEMAMQVNMLMKARMLIDSWQFDEAWVQGRPEWRDRYRAGHYIAKMKIRELLHMEMEAINRRLTMLDDPETAE